MDLNWTLPELLQHQYSRLMHSLLSVYSLCTLWWRWTCESLCCLLVFWHCQEPEEALRSHPAAACRSKPSTKAAEGRRFFYFIFFFFFLPKFCRRLTVYPVTGSVLTRIPYASNITSISWGKKWGKVQCIACREKMWKKHFLCHS